MPHARDDGTAQGKYDVLPLISNKTYGKQAIEGAITSILKHQKAYYLTFFVIFALGASTLKYKKSAFP